MEKKVILVRSSKLLIKNGYIGYGWSQVDFSKFFDLKDLIRIGFKGINFGRKKNQIVMFHSLKNGDIVIVPIGRAIAIGVVEGTKVYEVNSNIKYSNNRIKVNFFKKDNDVLYVPRSQLGTDLERRLKIRMSIANLDNWELEIDKMVSDLTEGKIPTWDSAILLKEEQSNEEFINKLEERLRTEKGLGIDAGGYGLEKLIKEIFQAKGYDSIIPSKKERPIGEDIDIIARKDGEFKGEKGEIYFIQAKHHRGITKRLGLDQLIKCRDNEIDDKNIYKKVLITTAKVTKELKDEAKLHEIIIVEGIELAKWVYENLELLSKETIRSLGISINPILI